MDIAQKHTSVAHLMTDDSRKQFGVRAHERNYTMTLFNNPGKSLENVRPQESPPKNPGIAGRDSILSKRGRRDEMLCGWHNRVGRVEGGLEAWRRAESFPCTETSRLNASRIRRREEGGRGVEHTKAKGGVQKGLRSRENLTTKGFLWHEARAD